MYFSRDHKRHALGITQAAIINVYINNKSKIKSIRCIVCSLLELFTLNLISPSVLQFKFRDLCWHICAVCVHIAKPKIQTSKQSDRDNKPQKVKISD